MQYIVFDTETTGLSAADEVVQFAGLLLNEKLDLAKIINFYCQTQVPVNPEVTKITCLDGELLHKLSKGKFFEDYYYSIPVFKCTSLTWIGYNVGFDCRMINNTLVNNGLPVHNFGSKTISLGKGEGIYNLDVMQLVAAENNGIRKKLIEAAKELPHSQDELEQMFQKLLKLTESPPEVRFHNALYDAMVTWLILASKKRRCL